MLASNYRKTRARLARKKHREFLRFSDRQALRPRHPRGIPPVGAENPADRADWVQRRAARVEAWIHKWWTRL